MRLMSKTECYCAERKEIHGVGWIGVKQLQAQSKSCLPQAWGWVLYRYSTAHTSNAGIPNLQPKKKSAKQEKTKKVQAGLLFGDFGLKLYGPGPLIIWKNFLSQYALGPYLICTLFQEHVCYMFLEQCAFQIWSWLIFDLECSSRSLMVQD